MQPRFSLLSRCRENDLFFSRPPSLVGTLGAFLSRRAGGSRRAIFSSIIFPVVPFLAAILLITPVILAVDSGEFKPSGPKGGPELQGGPDDLAVDGRGMSAKKPDLGSTLT